MILAALDHGVCTRSELEAAHAVDVEVCMAQIARERAQERQLGLLAKAPAPKARRRQAVIRAAFLALILAGWLAGCGYAVRFGVPENWWSDTGINGPDAPRHQPARR